jgi:hypothetical protein
MKLFMMYLLITVPISCAVQLIHMFITPVHWAIAAIVGFLAGCCAVWCGGGMDGDMKED